MKECAPRHTSVRARSGGRKTKGSRKNTKGPLIGEETERAGRGRADPNRRRMDPAAGERRELESEEGS